MKFTKRSSLPLEIRSSKSEIRNKFKILISQSRKCTACKLARFEFSIWDIRHCFGFRASDFEFCLGGMRLLAMISVVRVFSRLNIGGPSIHVILLTAGLNPARFHSTLIVGQEGPQEGNMLELAESRG